MPRYNKELYIEPFVSHEGLEDFDLAKRILVHHKVAYTSIVSIRLEWITRSPDKRFYTVTYRSDSYGCDLVTSLNKETADNLGAPLVDAKALPEYRVIVAGGRTFNDPKFMAEKLDSILAGKAKTHRIVIVEGGARGADQHGEQYGSSRGYKIDEHLADWDGEGKSAGYNRNKRMAAVADACVCFWDGLSRGTKHMIDIAKEAKLPLRIIKY